jgi:flagellar biosynthesis protein FlhA
LDQIAQGLTDDGKRLALGPVLVQTLISHISQSVTQAIGQHGTQPVLLCNAKLRLPLYRLIQRTLPLVPVLSYNEVGPSVKANALGVVRLLAGAVEA